MLRAGRIVPKAELEKLVLGFDSVVASNALEVHVSALRRKLGRELIETVRGLGYRIEEPMSWRAERWAAPKRARIPRAAKWPLQVYGDRPRCAVAEGLS